MEQRTKLCKRVLTSPKTSVPQASALRPTVYLPLNYKERTGLSLGMSVSFKESSKRKSLSVLGLFVLGGNGGFSWRGYCNDPVLLFPFLIFAETGDANTQLTPLVHWKDLR